jgi:hypothetical protein
MNRDIIAEYLFEKQCGPPLLDRNKHLTHSPKRKYAPYTYGLHTTALKTIAVLSHRSAGGQIEQIAKGVMFANILEPLLGHAQYGFVFRLN